MPVEASAPAAMAAQRKLGISRLPCSVAGGLHRNGLLRQTSRQNGVGCSSNWSDHWLQSSFPSRREFISLPTKPVGGTLLLMWQANIQRACHSPNPLQINQP